MIRLYLLLLLIAAAGAVAAYTLHSETGYVMISYRSWIIETSLMGFAVATVAALVALYYLFLFLLTALRLPALLRRATHRRRAARAQESFELGMLRLLEGNWRSAEIELVRRAADHPAQHLNYLGAARAAQRVGAGERRDHYLKLAMQATPEMEFATLLTQAELQRERGEHALTRDTALKLRASNPQHPYAIELLAESYAALGEWRALRELLMEPVSAQALAAARHRELLLQALRALMQQAVGDARLEQLKALWDAAPADIQKDIGLCGDYAHGLARLNAQAEALALVNTVLGERWDAALVRLYGGLQVTDAVSQLASVEQWLKQHGEQPDLLLTAGRVCLRNKLWGKARSYLEAALRTAPSATAYLELARLFEMTQNPAEAEKFYRQGLEQAALNA